MSRQTFHKLRASFTLPASCLGGEGNRQFVFGTAVGPHAKKVFLARRQRREPLREPGPKLVNGCRIDVIGPGKQIGEAKLVVEHLHYSVSLTREPTVSYRVMTRENSAP